MAATAHSGKTGKSGGFISSLAVPIGFVAEYREHRKELKQSRSMTDLKGASDYSISQRSVPLQSPPEYSEEAPPPLPARPNGHQAAVSQSTFASDEVPLPFHPNGHQDVVPQCSFASGGMPGGWAEYEDKGRVEDDEDLWDLDDASESNYWEPSPSELPANESVEGLVTGVMNMNIARKASVRNPPTKKGLPYPVIIPQRRPRAKARGFLRCYAPALGACGIDQDTFLEFLKNFHQASKASPVFKVVLCCSQVACNIPNHIINPIAITCNAVATVGSEVQARQRTNNFLDRMNEELFQPAGLYAMIVKYKTDLEMETTMATEQNLYNMISLGKVDLSTNQSIAKYSHLSSDGAKTMATRKQNLRVASGVTRGTIELPEACPLVFPDPDSGNVEEVPDNFKGKVKDASKFLSGYLDRRAQRSYAADNPDTNLTVPEEHRPFKSKYSDPSHPMYTSGTFMAFVSGGTKVPKASEIAAKREKALSEDLSLILDGHEPKDRYIARYGDGYYEELYSRAAQYRDIALQKDIDLIAKGSEPTSRQEERYGEGYYEELYNRTRVFRERALQEDVQSVLMGRAPAANREDVYGKGYNEELWSLTSGPRQKAIQFDLNTISSGGKPDVGRDLIYGTRYYTELSSQAQQWGMKYESSVDDNALTPSVSKSSDKKEGLVKKISGNNPFNRVKRVIQEDVLYLMIVNMPSKTELDDAMAELKEAEKAKAAAKAAEKEAAKHPVTTP